MFDIFEGCNCKQKTIFAIIVIVYIFFSLGIFIALQNIKKKSDRFVRRFIIKILVSIIIYKFIEWCCKNNYNITATIITLIPLIFITNVGHKIIKNIAANEKFI
jgi:hypothetical protein